MMRMRRMRRAKMIMIKAKLKMNVLVKTTTVPLLHPAPILLEVSSVLASQAFPAMESHVSTMTNVRLVILCWRRNCFNTDVSFKLF